MKLDITEEEALGALEASKNASSVQEPQVDALDAKIISKEAIQLKKIQTALEKSLFSKTTATVFVAGGYIARKLTGEEISDIDLFFPTRKDIALFLKEARKSLKFKLIYRGVNFNRGTIEHYGQTIRVDVVKRLFINEFSVVDNFDFTACCFCISKTKMLYHKDAAFDLLTKRINIHNLPFPAGSLMRLQKYTKRGFTYCEGVVRSLMERVKDSDVSIPEQFMYEDGSLKASSMD